MHRKHIRATVGTADVDIPTGTFIADRFLYYNGIAIITVSALRGPSSATDNAVTRFDGTTGQLVQNSTVLIDDAGAVTGVTTLNTRDPARWVDGPAAGGSTDNAIARWDGTTGRLIQNSVVVIDDTGAVTGITSIDGVPVSDFVRGPTPAVAVDDHIATWDATSGRLIQDSGLHIGDVVYNFDAEAITNNLPKFQNSTGRRLTDSGIPAANVVQSPSTSTDNAVARYDGTTGKFIQDSVVIISDAGAITGVTTLNSVDPSTWVVGPIASTNLRVAAFNGTTGKLIQQANYELKNVAVVATGDGLTAGRIPQFSGSQTNSGTSIQDSGVVFQDIVFRTGSYTIGNVPRFVNSGGPSFILEDSGIPNSNIATGTGGATSGDLVRFTSAGPTSYRLAATGIAYQNVVSTNSNPSVDDRIVRYDGTTGVLIQQSTVTLSDTGVLTGVTAIGGIDPATWVVGPTTATDNAVARFNLTTGKLIQDSTVVIDDSGNITGVGTINGAAIGGWVVGPASATDNAVTRFDATTGKLVQNSVLTISDAGDLAGVVQINSINIANYMITSTGNSIGRVPVYNSGSSVTQSAVVISSGGVVSAVTTLNGIDPATWVVGPSSATDGRIAVYDGTTGKLLKDGSKLEADIVTGPASSTSGLVAVFSGITGKIIATGTRQEAALVEGPAVVADNTVPRFDGTTGKIIQGSTLVVADSTGDITGAGKYNGYIIGQIANRIVGGSTPVSYTFTAAGNATDFNIYFFIPYSVGGSANLTVSLLASSGFNQGHVMCGAQGGAITSNGGVVALLTTGATAIPAIGFVTILTSLTGFSAGATLTATLSGTSHSGGTAQIFAAKT